MPSYILKGNGNVKTVEITDSVTSIGDGAFSYCDNLTTVYYGGTASEWDEITIGYNYELTFATIYYYSATESTASGNYWHYVNGVPTVW